MKGRLTFEEDIISGSGIDAEYEVQNHRRERLGVIAYCTEWKRFCFYPDDETWYSWDCLQEIVNVLKTLPRK